MWPNVNRKKTARCPPSSEPSVSVFLHTQQNPSLFQGIPSLFNPQGIPAPICPQPGLPALPRGRASHRGTPCLSFLRSRSPGLSGTGKLQYTVASAYQIQRRKELHEGDTAGKDRPEPKDWFPGFILLLLLNLFIF